MLSIHGYSAKSAHRKYTNTKPKNWDYVHSGGYISAEKTWKN